MNERRFQTLHLPANPEPLPGEFGADLSRLDRELGGMLSRVEAPVGLAGRLHDVSASFLAPPASLPIERAPQVVLRQRRTMWARLAVAASLGVLCVLSLRVVMQNGSPAALQENGQPEMVMQASLEQPLPHAVEVLLLDRAPNRSGEEIAYLFDPDPRESSEMSLFVQTREVTLDDVSVELAMLDADLRM